MRRTLLAVLFFVGLVAIWAALVNAKIWSPVLLPSPRNVVDYLVSAARDGSLLSASTVTLRRLLVGYLIGLAIGLPLGLLTASLKFPEDGWRARARPANFAERLLGPAGVAVVRTDRRRNALCCNHGNGLVSRDRDRHRRAYDPTNLCPRGPHNGLGPTPSRDVRHFAGITAVFNKRNEAGLGVCLAFVNGRGNLCHDSDWVRSWPSASLWSRIKRDGPGDRHHAGDRHHRFAGGQNLILALGTFFAPPLGNRQNVSIA